MRRCYESSERLQKNIHNFVLIESLHGFGMKHVKKVLVEIIKKIIAIDEKYYPELMNKVFVVHAPSFFSSAYSMFSGFIDPVTREKIFVFSKDFLPKVLETVQSENLPAVLGGTSKIPWRFSDIPEPEESWEDEEESGSEEEIK